jgi:hypothetical protein
MRLASVAGAALVLCATVQAALACACGCGVFEVGAGSMLPTGQAANIFVRYDFLDQSRNWSGSSRAPASANDDKRITTDFIALGGQVRIDDNWTVMAEVPVWNRLFRTETDNGIETFRHTALGDIRLMTSYTGLSDATTSTGFIAGVKLDTGDTGYPHFDADVSIGSGSTDALLGAYHTGPLSADGVFVWYGNVLWDKPLATRANYKPGSEIDAALGVFYGGFAAGDVQITPMLQAVVATRIRDSGAAADPPNTGYTRLLLSPGVEFTWKKWSVYADVQFPIYQYVIGNQLVAPQQFNLVLSYALGD